MADRKEGAAFNAMDSYEAIMNELGKLRFIVAAIADGTDPTSHEGATGGMALIIDGAIDGIQAQAELMRISENTTARADQSNRTVAKG